MDIGESSLALLPPLSPSELHQSTKPQNLQIHTQALSASGNLSGSWCQAKCELHPPFLVRGSTGLISGFRKIQLGGIYPPTLGGGVNGQLTHDLPGSRPEV